MQGKSSKDPTGRIGTVIVLNISQYMMKPGATPNETTSESESKSAPMGEWALSKRAEKPSKKSKRPATKIMMAALTGIPQPRNRIDKQPESRLQQVIAFGICCLMFMFDVILNGQKYEKHYFCSKIFYDGRFVVLRCV